MMPQDPIILLSFVNTKLRDEFDSIEKLCYSLKIQQEKLSQTLSAIDYEYDRNQNQFI